MVKSRAAWLFATFFGVGYLRPGPGTYASAATLLLWWAVSRTMPAPWLLDAGLALALVILVIGIPASGIVARESGLHDPGYVVIDEVAGQLVALLGIPVTWKYLLASFILFRGFDIVKPFPLRRLESLPGGTGIMIDDVGAGAYSLLLMQIWLHFIVR